MEMGRLMVAKGRGLAFFSGVVTPEDHGTGSPFLFGKFFRPETKISTSRVAVRGSLEEVSVLGMGTEWVHGPASFDYASWFVSVAFGGRPLIQLKGGTVSYLCNCL